MVVVVEGIVGAATVQVGVPTHWPKKTTIEASTQRRGWWGWRQWPVAPEFPAGFLLGRDRRAPFGTTGRVSRA
jgi:hypothetical protein